MDFPQLIADSLPLFQLYVVTLPSEQITIKKLRRMKQKKQLLGIITTVCLCLVFTSCHKDEKIAMKLSGEWEGYWGMYYRDAEGNRFDSYKSSVVFYPDAKYDTKGTGYQIDWYRQEDGGQYEKMFYEFSWRVDDKVIHLYYPGYAELNVSIRNYDLSKQHFTGYFNNSPTRFDLNAIWKVYKWSDYASLNMETAGNILAWTWTGLVIASELSSDSYYYSRELGTDDDQQGINVLPMDKEHSFTLGNRFAEE